MGTIENGKIIMKMGYRNFKTQEIWLFEENIMGVEKTKIAKLNKKILDGKIIIRNYRNYENYTIIGTIRTMENGKNF